MVDAVRIVAIQLVAFLVPVMQIFYWMMTKELAMVAYHCALCAVIFIKLIVYIVILDINECEDTMMFPCSNTFMCSNIIGGYECICPLGTVFNGMICGKTYILAKSFETL